MVPVSGWIQANVYGLLFVFTFIAFKPVLPYLDYMLNREYIINNLCVNKDVPEKQCNGKCHLEKQIVQASEDPESKESPIPQVNNSENHLEYVLPKSDIRLRYIVEHEAETFYQMNYSFEFENSIFRPPMEKSLYIEC